MSMSRELTWTFRSPRGLFRLLCLTILPVMLSASRCDAPRPPSVDPATASQPPPATALEDRCLDEALRKAHLNEFGDPPGTVYPGGSPLFDEKTGRVTRRRDYIRQHHPDLAAACPDQPSGRP